MERQTMILSEDLLGTLMTPDRRTLLLPIILIAVGSGWLLSTMGVAPNIDWIWTLCLASVGVLTFAVCGIDKATVVVGPFFLIASGLSVLRQSNWLRMDVELPILIILAGVLLLVARNPSIPNPKWMSDETKPKTDA